MGKTLQYQVARWTFRIDFLGSDDEDLLPSFSAFQTETDHSSPLLFALKVDDSFCPERQGNEVGQFDCGGNTHGVYLLTDGSCQILMRDVCGQKCGLMQANADFSQGVVSLRGTQAMRRYGLNTAIMMMFAFASADKDTLLMHSSVVRKAGIGYLFLGTSGTGKSTHTANWLRYIDGTDLMNDDNPVVRVIDNEVLVFGSPWSGKTPCYRNIEAHAGGFVQLRQAPYNKIQPLSVLDAYRVLLSSCSLMKWDRRDYVGVCTTIDKVLSHTRTYLLDNLPDEAAVLLSHSTLTAS